MAYTRQSTIDTLEKALDDPDTLYSKRFVNRKGQTSDNKGEFYTEVISERLLDDIHGKYLERITPRTRTSSYRVKGHQVGSGRQGQGGSNRREEVLAKSLHEVHGLGRVIDYQVPLKDRRNDKGVGKIDLIAEGESEIWLIEFKYRNKDTLLRCVLEIATYAQQLDEKKFLKDFNLRPSTTCRRAVLFDRSSLAYKELEELRQRPKLQRLLKELDVVPFFFDMPVITSVKATRGTVAAGSG